MIYCSSLPNDQDMIRALGSLALPFPVPCGDACFFGASDSPDSSLRVCVERKKVHDMAACILSGRYLYQLQTAHDCGFDIFALILEGRYDYSLDDGLVTIPGWDSVRGRSGWKPVKPAIAFSRFEQYLTELEHMAGVIVKRSEHVRGTAAIIRSLWDGFQKPPDGHKSLKVIYKSVTGGVSLTRPSLVRRMASELPGVGWERSGIVAQHFVTVRAMINADDKEWRSLDGIGKITARRVVEAIGGKPVILDKRANSVVE